MQIFDGQVNITAVNANPNSGVPTANSFDMVDLRVGDGGMDTVSVQVTGTFVATLVVQVSNDGNNWVTMGGTPLINVGGGSNQASITAAGVFQVDVAGFRFVRVSCSAFTSGTAVVSVVASDANGVVSIETPLPAGSNQIGLFGTPNGSNSNQTAAATTNATSVKTSAGSLFEITIDNLAATPRYLKLYNKASAPTVGTDVPILTIPVLAGDIRQLAFGQIGKRFTTGIAFAITGAAAVSDTTAIVAGETHTNLTYI